MNRKREKLEVDSSWSINGEIFLGWVEENKAVFSPHEPNFFPEPTMKILIFLALVESGKTLSYDEIHQFLLSKGVISGNISRNTLRTSASNLKRSLNDCEHSLDVASNRGLFQILKRSEHSSKKLTAKPKSSQKTLVAETVKVDPMNRVILVIDTPAIKAEEIANTIVQKTYLPFTALCVLEWCARWWTKYAVNEVEARVQYEVNVWEKLGIRDRLYKSATANEYISIIALEPREGISQIELLKKILNTERTKVIHYLAIETSPRLLRDHIELLKEMLALEICDGRLLCAGVLSDIFSDINEAINKAREKFLAFNIIQSYNGFFPPDSGLLVTLLENCFGNNLPDKETEIFSIIRSTFKNRPLEFLVGASVTRNEPDLYDRSWDEFLLQTPKHLLEITKLLVSLQPENSQKLPEFVLPLNDVKQERCPTVKPDYYMARHGITGQIYRFYYKLEFDLKLAESLNKDLQPLPKGTQILLLNIIKYDIKTLIKGIVNGMSFMVDYDESYHKIIKTDNGEREYALFSAYLEE